MEQDTSVTRTIAEIADVGAFGRDDRFVSFELDGQHAAGQDQFASTVLYGTVTTADDTGVRRRVRLVLKFKPRLASLRDMYSSDKQFHNEALFYERIAPFLLDRRVPAVHAPPLCRYFHGRNDCGDRVLDDLIVLENATVRGYRMSAERLHLDLDHLVVALRSLAKFHGLSYRAKHEDPTGFAKTVAGIEETQYVDAFGGEWMIGDAGTASLFTAVLDRLAERCGTDAYERALSEFLRGPTATMRRVMRADEPLAVVCHGDFNRNNVMFRYDGDGRPVDALPFDMATVRYGSPALDLSFFLYMNTDRATRDRHWDALLDEYCAALSAAASNAPAPDRRRLDAEMRDRAVYGLAHASFFVRVMAADQVVDPAEYTEFDEETVRTLMSLGGDRATDLIADAVQHFVDRVTCCAADDAPPQ